MSRYPRTSSLARQPRGVFLSTVLLLLTAGVFAETALLALQPAPKGQQAQAAPPAVAPRPDAETPSVAERLVISVALAVASYELVEKPFLRRKRRHTPASSDETAVVEDGVVPVAPAAGLPPA
jgi:hypothetical protein